VCEDDGRGTLEHFGSTLTVITTYYMNRIPEGTGNSSSRSANSLMVGWFHDMQPPSMSQSRCLRYNMMQGVTYGNTSIDLYLYIPGSRLYMIICIGLDLKVLT
jgi:hypothetical protein